MTTTTGAGDFGLRTVFLDAGGVLVFPDWTRISTELGKRGIHVDPAALAAAEPYAKRELDRKATIHATNDAKRGWLYFEMIFERAHIPLSTATTDALAELHRYHQEFNLWGYMPADVMPSLRALRNLGLRLVIVSNANGTVARLAERLGLTECVGCVLDSHVEKVEKPDPRFFEIAMQRSGADADTSIHVGDLYEVDVVGARAAGITPVLLDAVGLYPEADCLRVRTLPQVVELVSNGTFRKSG
jgi:HAD superfamily hydrolase (TIGR01549 family)